MKSYLECDALVRKNHEGQYLEVEIDGKSLNVAKLLPAVDDVKAGQKVQLKYSKHVAGSQLPYKPTAVRVLARV